MQIFCAQLYTRIAASWRATKLCSGTWSWEFSPQQDKRRKRRISARQGAGPGACCALCVMGVAPGAVAVQHCTWAIAAPLLIAGTKRRQKRSSSHSIFPKYNPEIFSSCFWLKKLPRLNLQHHQTSAPGGADNSLSNVISIDLKMRFAFAILCGIWSPLMSRSCSGWNVFSPAQLPTLEQVVGAGSFTVLCWNTGWYPGWMKDMRYVCWLYMQITTLITAGSTGTSSGPNPALYRQETDVFFSLQLFFTTFHLALMQNEVNKRCMLHDNFVCRIDTRQISGRSQEVKVRN